MVELYDFKNEVVEMLETREGTEKQKDSLLKLMTYCFQEGYKAKEKRDKKIKSANIEFTSTKRQEL